MERKVARQELMTISLRGGASDFGAWILGRNVVAPFIRMGGRA
jgi:hypothetical protein